MDIFEKSLAEHKKLKGKFAVVSKAPLNTKEDLATYYSPGVAAVSRHLTKHPEETPLYTSTNNTVAIISDGSAVLGLGNIGPQGALPVMEGKAILFKAFADIDGIPIVLNTQDPDEIINIVSNIAPSFGGINLEDIASPNCFYIESELKKKLRMPIMHDDQHGTAIVVLAGLINACKVTERDLSSSRIVISGSGAAGIAITKLLFQYAHPKITAVDSKGIISDDRTDLNDEKKILLDYIVTNTSGSLADALTGADIFIGVSKGGIVSQEMVRSMAPDPIVFGLANPEPEIMPDLAKAAGAAVVATGRSDFPNQVNNVLAFPGIFRGALDTQSVITDAHKTAAAEAIASIIKSPNPDLVIPSPFEPQIATLVAAVFTKKL